MQTMRPDLKKAVMEYELGLLDIGEDLKKELRMKMDLQSEEEKRLKSQKAILGVTSKALWLEAAKLGIYRDMNTELEKRRKMIEQETGKTFPLIPMAGRPGGMEREAFPDQARIMLEIFNQLREAKLGNQGMQVPINVEPEINVKVEVNAEASEIGKKTAEALQKTLTRAVDEAIVKTWMETGYPLKELREEAKRARERLAGEMP